MTPRGAASPTPRPYPSDPDSPAPDGPVSWRMLYNRVRRLRKFVELEPMAPRPIIEAEIALIERARDLIEDDFAGLIAALRQIEALEKRADGVVGMVDDPHTRALRAACEIARRVLAQSDEPNKEGAKP